MEIVAAFTAGLLVAIGVWMLLDRGLLRVVLGIAAVAGLVGLFHGEPFLTGNWIFPAGLPLGTPLLFDVGVFLTVLGAVLHMLLGLLEREG